MAVKGYNSVVQVKGLGGVYVEIAKCKQNDFFDGSNATVDVTHNRSTGRHAEREVTLRDTAPMNLDLIYDDSSPTHTLTSTVGLHYLLASGETRGFKMITSSAVSYTHLTLPTNREV
mgnify:CR=1 FL=1